MAALISPLRQIDVAGKFSARLKPIRGAVPTSTFTFDCPAGACSGCYAIRVHRARPPCGGPSLQKGFSGEAVGGARLRIRAVPVRPGVSGACRFSQACVISQSGSRLWPAPVRHTCGCIVCKRARFFFVAPRCLRGSGLVLGRICDKVRHRSCEEKWHVAVCRRKLSRRAARDSGGRGGVLSVGSV